MENKNGIEIVEEYIPIPVLEFPYGFFIFDPYPPAELTIKE